MFFKKIMCMLFSVIIMFGSFGTTEAMVPKTRKIENYKCCKHYKNKKKWCWLSAGINLIRNLNLKPEMIPGNDEKLEEELLEFMGVNPNSDYAMNTLNFIIRIKQYLYSRTKKDEYNKCNDVYAYDCKQSNGEALDGFCSKIKNVIDSGKVLLFDLNVHEYFCYGQGGGHITIIYGYDEDSEGKIKNLYVDFNDEDFPESDLFKKMYIKKKTLETLVSRKLSPDDDSQLKRCFQYVLHNIDNDARFELFNNRLKLARDEKKFAIEDLGKLSWIISWL